MHCCCASCILLSISSHRLSFEVSMFLATFGTRISAILRAPHLRTACGWTVAPNHCACHPAYALKFGRQTTFISGLWARQTVAFNFVSPNVYFCKVVWLVQFRDDSAKQFFQHFCKVYGWRTWILCSIFVAEVKRGEVSLAVVVSLRPKKGSLWASRFHPTQFRVGYTWCEKKKVHIRWKNIMYRFA